jgi:branched-chain amino acid aminotransferase
MLNHNGKLISEGRAGPFRNRAFRYGDGLFETMRLSKGRIPLWERHWKRLTSGLELIGISAHRLGDSRKMLSELRRTAEGMEHARIRLTVYREGMGAYAPQENQASFAIDATEIGPLNSLNSGIHIGIFKELKLPHGHPFWNLKTCNALPYILAANYAKKKNWDEALLINTSGYLAEGSSTNLFIWKNNELVTPPLSSGCVAGLMRDLILEMARQNHISAAERQLLPSELTSAEEIWLVNAVRGIQSVQKLDLHPYSSEHAREFMEMIKIYFL